MTDLLTISHGAGYNIIVMDDGKANVMSGKMLAALNKAIDQAEARGGVLVLQGRPGMFSGGFDLNVFKSGDKAEKLNMLMAGAEITERLLGYPYPTVAACTGHSIAMGLFLLLSFDMRIGVKDNFKFAANEVAIGLTIPRFGITVARQRLTPSALNRGLTLAHSFDIQSAVHSGILDELASADQFATRVAEVTTQLGKLHMESHRATKLRLRAELLMALRVAIEEDFLDWEREPLQPK